jgi:hypothetical protein
VVIGSGTTARAAVTAWPLVRPGEGEGHGRVFGDDLVDPVDIVGDAGCAGEVGVVGVDQAERAWRWLAIKP